MRANGKPPARAFQTSSATRRASPTALEPPPPFHRAPATRAPFLAALDQSHVYITHLDTKPRAFKQKIFLVPLLMNLIIAGVVIWRIRSIGPYYLKIGSSLLGRPNETTLDTTRLALRDAAVEVGRRSAVFVVDLWIYVLLWPWPRQFFTGRVIGNPVAWRRAIGFRPQEIIVRRSRAWDRALGNEWDLDWDTMITATRLADTKVLAPHDFRTTIYVHSDDFGWMVMESANAGGSAAEEEGRKKIVAFKDELTALGKENLFFKWIELVQYESSRPGGFTPAQQVETMAQAREMFEAQGVDFDQFWEKVGGMEGMPGMDQM
ncbi:hypothetical protein BUE80_DR003673 [Diplocarpon rosae]|nr:hypothetical protein BUE80_DR003673 [Diplocarpon rosae]